MRDFTYGLVYEMFLTKWQGNKRDYYSISIYDKSANARNEIFLTIVDFSI